MKKILLVGSQGQLGKEFANYFKDNEIAFLGIDLIQKEEKNYQVVNICDKQAVKEILQQGDFTHIINCAAYNAVDIAEEDFENANLLNNLAVGNLANLAKEFACQLVHYSTDYVFDGENSKPYKISDKPNPVSNYGKTKYFGELAVEQNADEFYIIRVSWLFGIYGNNFVNKVISWSKNPELKISENETSAPTYTEDVVLGTMKLLESEKFGKYHFCNTSCTRYEWAKFILDKIDFSGKVEKVKKEIFNLPAKRPTFSVMDTSETEKILGYKFSSWQDVTKKFLEKLNNLER